MPMFLGMGGRTSVALMLAKECAVVFLLEDKLDSINRKGRAMAMIGSRDASRSQISER